MNAHQILRDLLEQIDLIGIPDWHSAEGLDLSAARAAAQETHTPATAAEIQTARDLYQTDDVEIDDNAAVSRTDEGMWVAAWVWINNEELEGAAQ